MQLVFPDDEATQPLLKLLALAKRWKKGQEQDENKESTTAPVEEPVHAPPPSSNNEDTEPFPLSHIDDEEMNDES